MFGLVGFVVLNLMNVIAFAAGDPAPATTTTTTTPAATDTVYSYKLKDIDGKEVELSKYKGDVLLIVNTASECGLTPQYEGLETLFKKYKDKGFKVLAFPANNFGGQEPGSDSEIKNFCSEKYHVSFPLFSKISVKGDDQNPLYKFLTTHSNKDIAGDVKWNFQKYLVGRDGKVIKKFDPRVTPDDKTLAEEIDKAVAVKKP